MAWILVHSGSAPGVAVRDGVFRRGLAALAAVLVLAPVPRAAPVDQSGESIYRELCAGCHGLQGEGVAGKVDEPLYGTRSVEALTQRIHRTMPENDPALCVDDDAGLVAAYIHETFYSPEARARRQPPRMDLVRLTNRQYRESIADLAGSFLKPAAAAQSGGLRAEYYRSEGMNKKQQLAFEREDAEVAFDFGEGSPGAGMEPDQFSIAWAGSLLAADTGFHEFRLRTPNGARLYLNTDLRPGDRNRRDDSDAKRQPALIDLWVSSGGAVREETARVFLLGGRPYPLRLDFFKYKETHAAVRLEWRPPFGVWSVLSTPHLSPTLSPAVTVVQTPFPPDDGSLGYERGSSVSKDWHEASTRAAVEAANLVLDRLDLLSRAPELQPERTHALRRFAADFAARAFRRPLPADLRPLYVDQQFGDDLPPESSVKRVMLMVLTSPRFLYPELDGPDDDYAVATRLALALWDSLPDPALLAAAERGELREPEQVREQARRMMDDPRARAKVRDFFHHWLGLDETARLSKDAEAFPGFDEALVADLRTSLDRFVEDVVWGETSDYRELLLADYLFLNPRLAAFYGAPIPEEESFVRVRLGEEPRAGILTHPYLLAALSYHRSTSPIHRGVFLTRNVLGRFLRPPPMAIEFMDDRFDPTLTMREKVTELTRSPTCMACHVTINPLGFSLETFDAVGRFRSTDQGKPVDAEADYTGSDGEQLRLRNARDVAEHAALSEDARLGFVRHLFHSLVKQNPAAYGPDTLPKLDRALVASGFNLRELVLEIVDLVALNGRNPALAANPTRP